MLSKREMARKYFKDTFEREIDTLIADGTVVSKMRLLGFVPYAALKATFATMSMAAQNKLVTYEARSQLSNVKGGVVGVFTGNFQDIPKNIEQAGKGVGSLIGTGFKALRQGVKNVYRDPNNVHLGDDKKSQFTGHYMSYFMTYMLLHLVIQLPYQAIRIATKSRFHPISMFIGCMLPAVIVGACLPALTSEKCTSDENLNRDRVVGIVNSLALGSFVFASKIIGALVSDSKLLPPFLKTAIHMANFAVMLGAIGIMCFVPEKINTVHQKVVTKERKALEALGL